MRDNNIKPAEAADILGVSPQFVRVAMQQGKLNIGIAIQLYRSIYLHNSDSRGRVRRCCNMVSESGTA